MPKSELTPPTGANPSRYFPFIHHPILLMIFSSDTEPLEPLQNYLNLMFTETHGFHLFKKIDPHSHLLSMWVERRFCKTKALAQFLS